MATQYELTGRTRQKARTRAALVTAARELLAEGVNPTVEEAADAAGVSRTTAYRYFPNQRALLLAGYPELSAPSLLGDDAPEDPGARLDAVVESVSRQLLDHEPELRTMLRLSLETPPPDPEELPLRRGRVIGWIEDALAPLRGRISDEEVHALALAIRSATGIEAFVWLTDVGGLTRKEAAKSMRWTARAQLESALRGQAPQVLRGQAP